MKLNSKQLKVMFVSLVIFVAMGVFPPWVYTTIGGFGENEMPAVYGLITAPPYPDGDGYRHGIRIDIMRLVVQWVTLVGATIGMILMLNGVRDINIKDVSK